ncbi:MAG: class I SAM-dependent methyltransferase [Candidatus Hodarchaeota archaeon]
MDTENIYARQRVVTDINECYFYHTIDLPGFGTIEGNWDLRAGLNQYLGGVHFRGKRVLEIGTANGLLCFEMERRGAEVIAFDLSKDYKWDLIPFAQYDYQKTAREHREVIDRLNNAFWFCHRVYNSRAKVVYGNAYNIPDEIGPVDIVIYGSILLHLRDPFLALQGGLRFARECVIITEVLRNQAVESTGPYMQFLPDHRKVEPKDTWWDLRPEVIVRMIGVLGFEDASVTYHTQKYEGKDNQMYTVVGRRTRAFSNLK